MLPYSNCWLELILEYNRVTKPLHFLNFMGLLHVQNVHTCKQTHTHAHKHTHTHLLALKYLLLLVSILLYADYFPTKTNNNYSQSEQWITNRNKLWRFHPVFRKFKWRWSQILPIVRQLSRRQYCELQFEINKMIHGWDWRLSTVGLSSIQLLNSNHGGLPTADLGSSTLVLVLKYT